MPFKFIAIPLIIFYLLVVLIPPVTMATGVNDVLNDLDNTAKGAKIISSATGAQTPTVYTIVGNIINLVLSFLGVAFLCLIIYGGIIWLTSAGNPEKVKQSRGIIIHSTIGLIIVLAAFLLTSFVISQIIGSTLPSATSQDTSSNDACGAKYGTCQDITTNPCAGIVFTGLCPGAANNKCCVTGDQLCTQDLGGICQTTPCTGGHFVSNTCGSDLNPEYRCCVVP